jgi:hypothetical protein
MILARLVLEFDVKMPGGGRERYKQVEVGRQSMPSPGEMLVFRKVRV